MSLIIKKAKNRIRANLIDRNNLKKLKVGLPSRNSLKMNKNKVGLKLIISHNLNKSKVANLYQTYKVKKVPKVKIF